MMTLTQSAKSAAAVAVTGLAMGMCLLAAPQAAGAATGTAAAASAQDTAWAQGNAQTDLAEIAIGQIAEQRAAHTTTKMLAQMTMTNHQEALSELKTVASQAGITLPTTPSATQQGQAAELKNAPASEFDVTYDSIQVQGHKLSISQTQTEMADGSSAAVKHFASVYLPVAEKHLKMAEDGYTALTGSAPGINAGSGGMAATPQPDDAPWLAAGAAGALLLAGTGVAGLRRRLHTR